MVIHDPKIPTRKATFAMGCFWGPDSLFGATKGVVRTRVGYAGGQFDNPTYHNLGDHTESIDIDYDPTGIHYRELIQLYWSNHDPTAITTTQYTSIIFYHDEEQKQIAEDTKKEIQQKVKREVITRIIPFENFYDAEDYHQKYRLQHYDNLMEAVGLTRGSLLKKSQIAAKLNGYVVGFGGLKQFDEEVKTLDLDEKTAESIRRLIIKYEGQGMMC